MWQSNNSLKATYKNLLGKFITARHIAGANAVCEVLQKKGKMWCSLIIHLKDNCHGSSINLDKVVF